jgi:hypothetical protein
MTLVLKKAELFRYKNDDHVAFQQSAYSIFAKYSAVINAPELVAAHKAAVDQETAVCNWIRKNEFTEKKAVADHRRDDTLTGMIGAVRSNLRHFDPAVCDAATHVYNLIENYGDTEKKDYDAETMVIDNIVGQLRSANYSAAVKLLNILPWVNRLEADNNEFKAYAADSVAVQLEKPSISLRDARRISDEALRAITNRMTSLINLNGSSYYTDFAGEYNELVSHYNTVVNEHYGRLHAKIDIAPAIIDPIAEQPFTAKPVIVIPKVHIRLLKRHEVEETVELFFSEDFTVSYRNNVNPGTASLVIKGIGKYKGEAVTTFNIL